MIVVRDQIKMALWHADSMCKQTVGADSMTTLWQITGKAHSMVNSLKSEVSGNEPPKMG